MPGLTPVPLLHGWHPYSPSLPPSNWVERTRTEVAQSGQSTRTHSGRAPQVSCRVVLDHPANPGTSPVPDDGIGGSNPSLRTLLAAYCPRVHRVNTNENRARSSVPAPPSSTLSPKNRRRGHPQKGSKIRCESTGQWVWWLESGAVEHPSWPRGGRGFESHRAHPVASHRTRQGGSAPSQPLPGLATHIEPILGLMQALPHPSAHAARVV